MSIHLKIFFYAACLLESTFILFAQCEESDSSQQEGSKLRARDYCEFLNAISIVDSHYLYELAPTRNDSTRLITRSGKPGSYHYNVSARSEDAPANFLSRFDAALYCNWKNATQKKKISLTDKP